MTYAVVDDHLLRDVLGDEPSDQLVRIMRTRDLATTNLYFVRLCKSVVAARGGQLTGGWSLEHRRTLGRRLAQLPDSIRVLPMTSLGFRMAELAEAHRLSTLGAEAVAASEHLAGALCVWEGDDGPGIRAAAQAAKVTHVVVTR